MHDVARQGIRNVKERDREREGEKGGYRLDFENFDRYIKRNLPYCDAEGEIPREFAQYVISLRSSIHKQAVAVKYVQ